MAAIDARDAIDAGEFDSEQQRVRQTVLRCATLLQYVVSLNEACLLEIMVSPGVVFARPSYRRVPFLSIILLPILTLLSLRGTRAEVYSGVPIGLRSLFFSVDICTWRSDIRTSQVS